jgi:prevent-host-death family protein
MKKVQANTFQRNIGTYQDMALTEPLTITRWGRPATVIQSRKEYERQKQEYDRPKQENERLKSFAEGSLKRDGTILQAAAAR